LTLDGQQAGSSLWLPLEKSADARRWPQMATDRNFGQEDGVSLVSLSDEDRRRFDPSIRSALRFSAVAGRVLTSEWTAIGGHLWPSAAIGVFSDRDGADKAHTEGRR